MLAIGLIRIYKIGEIKRATRIPNFSKRCVSLLSRTSISRDWAKSSSNIRSTSQVNALSTVSNMISKFKRKERLSMLALPMAVISSSINTTF